MGVRPRRRAAAGGATFWSATEVVIAFTPLTKRMFCLMRFSQPEQCICGSVVTVSVSLVWPFCAWAVRMVTARAVQFTSY